ncbi:hypothetical protein GCM10028807_62910 [Spirosoma daeguense]
MYEKHRKSGWLAMAILGMAMSGINTRNGSPFSPPPPTEGQKRQMEQDAKQIQKLHRFVIKGKEVFAKNKKEAIKLASRI